MGIEADQFLERGCGGKLGGNAKFRNKNLN